MRTPYGMFPEYHTSLDNLDFIDEECLQDTVNKYLEVINMIERNRIYINTNPKCEPQLGKRGLYRAIGGGKQAVDHKAITWLLNLSDGNHSLLDICERSDVDFKTVAESAEALINANLLVEKAK